AGASARATDCAGFLVRGTRACAGKRRQRILGPGAGADAAARRPLSRAVAAARHPAHRFAPAAGSMANRAAGAAERAQSTLVDRCRPPNTVLNAMLFRKTQPVRSGEL